MGRRFYLVLLLPSALLVTVGTVVGLYLIASLQRDVTADVLTALTAEAASISEQVTLREEDFFQAAKNLATSVGGLGDVRQWWLLGRAKVPLRPSPRGRKGFDQQIISALQNSQTAEKMPMGAALYTLDGKFLFGTSELFLPAGGKGARPRQPGALFSEWVRGLGQEVRFDVIGVAETVYRVLLLPLKKAGRRVAVLAVEKKIDDLSVRDPSTGFAIVVDHKLSLGRLPPGYQYLQDRADFATLRQRAYAEVGPLRVPFSGIFLAKDGIGIWTKTFSVPNAIGVDGWVYMDVRPRIARLAGLQLLLIAFGAFALCSLLGGAWSVARPWREAISRLNRMLIRAPQEGMQFDAIKYRSTPTELLRTFRYLEMVQEKGRAPTPPRQSISSELQVPANLQAPPQNEPDFSAFEALNETRTTTSRKPVRKSDTDLGLGQLGAQLVEAQQGPISGEGTELPTDEALLAIEELMEEPTLAGSYDGSVPLGPESAIEQPESQATAVMQVTPELLDQLREAASAVPNDDEEEASFDNQPSVELDLDDFDLSFGDEEGAPAPTPTVVDQYSATEVATAPSAPEDEESLEIELELDPLVEGTTAPGVSHDEVTAIDESLTDTLGGGYSNGIHDTAPTVIASPDQDAIAEAGKRRFLYEQFMQMRQQCGEIGSLTMGEFEERLDQSRKAILERHHCSDVRFEVYTKEGKAALKATPIP